MDPHVGDEAVCEPEYEPLDGVEGLAVAFAAVAHSRDDRMSVVADAECLGQNQRVPAYASSMA